MRCAAFCITLSERAARTAKRSAGSIDRIRDRVTVFGCESKGALDHAPVLTVLQFGEGVGLPVVHGLAGKPNDAGEYALAASESGTLEVFRDVAGTRPLYIGESGDWIASDHRFFGSEGRRLLSPGSRYEVLSGRSFTKRYPRAEFRGDFDEAARALAQTVDQCVEERVRGRRRVGVAFSGGLDSSILARCASRYCEVIACSVYSSRAPDKAKAMKAAGMLGLKLEAKEVDREEVSKELSSMDLPFDPSAMDRSLWCIYSFASRAAAEAGAELIMLGQLADELFCGYDKYARAARGNSLEAARVMMEEDLANCGMRGLIRDEAACSRWTEPRFPFADGRVLRMGLSMPVEFKLKDGVRKALLREAARLLGVPDELAMSPKKAAQYSSGMLKLVS